MRVVAAYAAVIAIWSTTPLAIKWSGQDVGFLFGISSRMLISAALCAFTLRVIGTRLVWHGAAFRTYLAAFVGMYGAMSLVYWGAQYIPSGLVSLLFGLTPLITGLVAAGFLPNEPFTPPKIGGVLIGLAGLSTVFYGALQDGQVAWQGVGLVGLSVVLHAFSGVWVKKIDAGLGPLEVTTGGLVLACPAFVATWGIFDGRWPQVLPEQVIGAILYLGVFGSFIGFTLYYFLLKRVSAAAASLITLVTPVFALILGHWLDAERLSLSVLAGGGLILLGLALFQVRSSKRFT